MPLKTFLNLSDTRKKEIINICLEEFALNDYESASLSGIVKKCRLAKGSFYRYFENKKDLYIYLIEYLGDIIRPHADMYLLKSEKDLFDSLRDYYLALIHMETEYPFYLRFLFKIRSEQNRIILKDIRYKKAKSRHSYIKDLLEIHQEKGNVRNDVDLNLLILIFSRMISVLFDYLSEKYRLDFGGNKKNNTLISSLDEEILHRELNIFLKTIKGVFIAPE